MISNVPPAEQRIYLAETVLGAIKGRVLRVGQVPHLILQQLFLAVRYGCLMSMNFRVLISGLQVPTANWAVVCAVRPTYHLAQELRVW